MKLFKYLYLLISFQILALSSIHSNKSYAESSHVRYNAVPLKGILAHGPHQPHKGSKKRVHFEPSKSAGSSPTATIKIPPRSSSLPENRIKALPQIPKVSGGDYGLDRFMQQKQAVPAHH